MTTWTEKTQEAETWTANTPGLHVFSSLVFSGGTYNNLHVYSFRNAQVEAFYPKTIQAESWTPV